MKPSPHVRTLSDDDGAVLLDLRAGIYFSLNKIATAVWEAVGRGESRHEILRLLCDRFDGTASEISESLDRFVDELGRRGLLED